MKVFSTLYDGQKYLQRIKLYAILDIYGHGYLMDIIELIELRVMLC